MKSFWKFALSAAIAMAMSATIAGEVAVVRVINVSSQDVWYVFTSPTGSKNYGSTDLLGGSIIPSGGGSVLIDFDVPDARNSCVQDIKAVTRSGSTWTKTFNVCTANNWTLRD